MVLDRKEVAENEVIHKDEIAYHGEPIRPISTQEVREIMDRQYATVLGFNDAAYTTTRGVEVLLRDSRGDYAVLPGIQGKTALDIFQSLEKGATWLDIGSGSGTFISQVLAEINSGLVAVGFDARTWKKEVEIPRKVFGNIDDLSAALFPDQLQGFNLITCASVLYHIPDYWKAIARMTDLLAQDGILLASTIVRPVTDLKPLDDNKGEFIADWVRQSGYRYYWNRNLFDSDGNLMSMADLLRAIKHDNPDFIIEYNALDHKKAMGGRINFGGGISVKRTGKGKLNLRRVFYCSYSDTSERNREVPNVSYIIAQSEEEVEKLKLMGFTSLKDRD